MSERFEIIIFTAAREDYADKMINMLDPNHKYVSHRLYRQHCVRYNGLCIKDLRVLADRNVDDVIIIDNFCYSFALNLENGIPIAPFTDAKEDEELRFLAERLSTMDENESAIQFVYDNFGLDQFYSFLEGSY